MDRSCAEEALAPAPPLLERDVAGWLMPDIIHYIFYLVWVCGIPCHVRYVIALMQRSAVAEELVIAAAGADGPKGAEEEVFLSRSRQAQYGSTYTAAAYQGRKRARKGRTAAASDLEASRPPLAVLKSIAQEQVLRAVYVKAKAANASISATNGLLEAARHVQGREMGEGSLSRVCLLSLGSVEKSSNAMDVCVRLLTEEEAATSEDAEVVALQSSAEAHQEGWVASAYWTALGQAEELERRLYESDEELNGASRVSSGVIALLVPRCLVSSSHSARNKAGEGAASTSEASGMMIVDVDGEDDDYDFHSNSAKTPRRAEQTAPNDTRDVRGTGTERVEASGKDAARRSISGLKQTTLTSLLSSQTPVASPHVTEEVVISSSDDVEYVETD